MELQAKTMHFASMLLKNESAKVREMLFGFHTPDIGIL